jgi:hypothetical protein
MWGGSANLVKNSCGSAFVTASKAAAVREPIPTYESKYRTIGKISVIKRTI